MLLPISPPEGPFPQVTSNTLLPHQARLAALLHLQELYPGEVSTRGKTLGTPCPITPKPNTTTPAPSNTPHQQELEATAVYHGLAAKHPLVPKLARQMRTEERSRSREAGLSTNGLILGGDGGDGKLSGAGRRRSSAGGGRGSVTSRSSLDKGRRSSKVGRGGEGWTALMTLCFEHAVTRTFRRADETLKKEGRGCVSVFVWMCALLCCRVFLARNCCLVPVSSSFCPLFLVIFPRVCLSSLSVLFIFFCPSGKHPFDA